MKHRSADLRPVELPGIEKSTEIKLTVRAVVETLENERHREIIILRFGLDGEPELTRKEVAEKLSIHVESARQIEAKALAYLRHPRRSNLLRGYIERT